MNRFDISWWKLLRGKIVGWALVTVVVLTLIFLEVVGYSDSAPGRHQLGRYAAAVLAVLSVALGVYLLSLFMDRPTWRVSGRVERRHCFTGRYLVLDADAIKVPTGILGKWISIRWIDIKARVSIRMPSGKRMTHLIIGENPHDITRLSLPEAQFVSAEEYQRFSAKLDEALQGLTGNRSGRTGSIRTQHIVYDWPWMTWSICLVLGFILLAQVLSGLVLIDGMFATVTWGGMKGGGAAWAEGQYYRLFAAPLLHLDVWHGFGNLALFMFIGPWAERVLGRATYLRVVVAGALGGALAGGVLSPYYYIVGSSGILAGLLGAALVVQTRHRRWLSVHDRLRFAELMMIAAAIVVVQVIYELSGYNIDHVSHAGGLIAGLVVTMILYSRPQQKNSPDQSFQIVSGNSDRKRSP